jgi:hypothetical protein
LLFLPPPSESDIGSPAGECGILMWFFVVALWTLK